jgi:sigma54 specific transcriptional regulator, Fis family
VPLKHAAASGRPQRVLHLHQTPRGEEHVDVELTPIRDADGQVIYFVEMMHTVRDASAHPSSRGLVGRSTGFNHMLGLVERVAPSEAAVLLLGGVGYR